MKIVTPQEHAGDFRRAVELADRLTQENARLRTELASRAIRTMGPRSPFWNCTICGAAKLTPIAFEHKPGCLLEFEPNPTALWPEGRGEQWPLICAAPALQKAVSDLIEAVDAGTLEMNSPEIGGHDDIPPHPWHEEWLHHARTALSLSADESSR